MLRGNRGEWSEVYVFLKILADGIIKSADMNLDELPGAQTQVIRILRQEKNAPSISYYPGKVVEVAIEEDSAVLYVENSNILDQAVNLYYEITSFNRGTGAFEIPQLEEFLSELKVTSLKAPSISKSDITLQIRDLKTGLNPICAWSIKSELGKPATLLNAGRTTNFIFKIDNCSEALMHELNAIECKGKLKKRLELLTETSEIHFVQQEDPTFERNLRLIDTNFPSIIALMLLTNYISASSSCRDIVDILEKSDPLNLGEGMYEYKFKKFLSSVALGMMPGTRWSGYEDVTGGYIVVRPDGEIVSFHIYNRNMFEDYLLEHTKFETASTSRHGFGSIYQVGNEFFINLNLQIRFK